LAGAGKIGTAVGGRRMSEGWNVGTWEYSTPATWSEYLPGSTQQLALNAAWSTNVESWIQQAYAASIPPDGGPSYFYDPSQTTIPPETAALQVAWSAWPNRLDFYLGGSSGRQNPNHWTHEQLLQLADTGYAASVSSPPQQMTFPKIPTGFALQCPDIDWDPAYSSEWQTYGPYGPRGWLDEYCEWSVTRDARNNVVRIDFVCENPEYWYTLWSFDPDKVRSVYEDTLNFDVPASQPDRTITVTLDDLSLHDPQTGATVIDPATGRAAYNPLNKWNSGPSSVRTAGAASGGAMHLTSTPNTLQTELGLASTATVQRDVDNTQTQELICCSQYGQIFRNSDPHIGQSVNLAVSAGPNKVCLADPVGLYIQMPQFEYWSFRKGANVPAGAKPSDCWHVVRGYQQLTDPLTGEPFTGQDYSEGREGVGNFILHAVMQIPSAWIEAGHSVTLADIEVDTVPLTWAGQVANHMNVGLYARPIPAGSTPAKYACLPLTPPPPPAPPSQSVNQLMYAVLWNAYYATQETIVMPDAAQTLASNTVIMAVHAAQGTASTMVLTASPPYGDQPFPAIQFSADGTTVDAKVTATVTAAETVTYAVPGNSYPGPNTAFTVEVTIAGDAAPGMRGVSITYAGQQPSFMPALLLVLPATEASHA
jgi:hypothetical protein